MIEFGIHPTSRSADIAVRIKILAWFHMLVSGAVLTLGVATLGSALFDRTATAYATHMIFWLLFWLSVFVLLPSLLGGLGLLWMQRWARVLLIVVSVEWLFLIPVGTAVGIFGLWVLLGRDADLLFSGQAPQGPARRNSAGVLLAMAAVAAAFTLVLAAGWLLSLRRFAGIPGGNAGIGTAMAIAIVALAFAFARVLGIPPRRRKPATLPSSPPVSIPVDPSAAAPCVHLQAIERAMTGAGIVTQVSEHSPVQAQCRVHLPSFRQQFASAGPIGYAEFFHAERSLEDQPAARLLCSQCSRRIDVLHPAECTLRTPWFPAPPAPLVAMADRTLASPMPITSVAVSPCGRLVAVAAGANQDVPAVVIWDAAGTRTICRLSPGSAIRSLAWSRDERVLFGSRGTPWPGGPGSRGPCLFAWDAGSGAELLRFGDELFGARGIALSPDGRLLLVSSMVGQTTADGSSLDLWETATGRMLGRVAQVTSDAHSMLPFFTGVAFTPDGALMLAACDRYRMPAGHMRAQAGEPPWWWYRGVRAWTVAGGQELDLIRLHSPASTLAVSRDGSRLFLAGERFGVWNLADGKELWTHAGSMDSAAAMSPDGRLVARGTGYRVDNYGPYEDTALEIYDGIGGGFVTLGRHRTTPSAIAFAGDGTSLVAGGQQGELRFWRMP